MAKRTWKDTDLSAYMDGELDPETAQALETRLAEDPALQQRLDQLVEVSTLVRAVPMREPPRNYLLTEAMVAEPAPAPERRSGFRLPLWAMRLATSLTAAAFVISLSLSLVQQGLSPRMMMEESAGQPQTEMMKLDAESTATVGVQALELESEEAAPVEEAPAEPLPTPMPQATLTAQEKMALEAMPGGPGVEQEGRGGGGEPPVAPEAASEEEAVADAPANDTSEAGAAEGEAAEVEVAEAEVADAVSPSPTPEPAQPEIAAQEAPAATPRTLGQDEALPPPPAPPVETPESAPRPNRWRWLAAVMGTLTAVLGALTIWTSRNRR